MVDLDTLNAALNIAIALACGALALISLIHLWVYHNVNFSSWDRTCTVLLAAFFMLAAFDKGIESTFGIDDIYVLNPYYYYPGAYPFVIYVQTGVHLFKAIIIWGLILYAATHRKEDG